MSPSLRLHLPAWLRRLVVGPLETNCYLLGAAGEGLVLVDPGGDAGRLVHEVEAASEGAGLAAVWLTHGHADHLAGLDGLLRRWPRLAVWASPHAAGCLQDPAANLSSYLGEPWALHVPGLATLEPGGQVHAAGRAWTAMATPGHTPGCLCYYAEAGRDDQHRGQPPVLLSGDLLFLGSAGRADLPGSCPADLVASLGRVGGLPPETLVLPGHGQPTTIAAERAHNPYLREALRLPGVGGPGRRD